MENESKTSGSPGDWLSEIKNWIQDNIRIVLSIIIVLAIALGVYSYSKRGAEEPGEQLAKEETEETNLQQLLEEGEEGEQVKEEVQESVTQETEEPKIEEEKQEPQAPQQEQQVEQQQAPEEMSAEEEAIVSQSGDNYEVTAAAGDSLTTLARSATKQYLDSSGDSSLNAEQKIYVEDYLAKKMGYSHYLKVGEMKSFSSNDLQEAVAKAKSLTPGQLDNLKVYSQRVPNL